MDRLRPMKTTTQILISDIQFTSDTVCYDVYRFNVELKDSSESVFIAVPKLAYPIEDICHSSRLCVDYVCSTNLRSHNCAKYYEHVARCDHAARFLLL